MLRIVSLLLWFAALACEVPANVASPPAHVDQVEQVAPVASRIVVDVPGAGRQDLTQTLARIERGEGFPHRNDGSVFQNREKRLPIHPRGYYREWVHPTPGRSGPGARRVVTGKGGEVWYTHDHYETFVRVRTR